MKVFFAGAATSPMHQRAIKARGVKRRLMTYEQRTGIESAILPVFKPRLRRKK